MKQFEFDFLDQLIEQAEENYSKDGDDFPECEIDSVVLSYNSPYANGFSVLSERGNETWPVLMVEFAKVLNKAGFQIDIDIVQSCVNEISERYTVKLDSVENSSGS
jgi:hypothetical protein